jgi:hypothetical protein
MTQRDQEIAFKKPYERPQVRRVKLESLEATMGTGCYQPEVSGLVTPTCGTATCLVG